LQSAGIEAFWDTEIPPGQTWADYIEGKLSLCKALIVLWSEHSTKSQWVREEARMGRDKGKLIPAMLDTSAAPFGFGEVQAANLSNWNGDPNDAEWKRVQGAVQAALGRPASAAPLPQAPPRYQAPPPPPAAQTFAGFNNNATSASAAGMSGASPIDYVRYCFQHYIDGKGRARRSEFWWFALFQVACGVVAFVLDISSFGINPYTSLPNGMLFTTVVWLALLCPAIAVTSRRFHDVGLNGWLVAVGYVLSVIWIGAIFILVVGFIPGQPGENKYGPNPKGV
jgi:uncharacterized membrane protein YhaH (DUF805 family)